MQRHEDVPQLLVNVRFTEGSGNPLENEHVKAVTAEVEAALGKRGRVLLRKSGTEPLIRVMVEGEHEDQVHEFAHRIAEAVKRLSLSAKWLKRRRLPPFYDRIPAFAVFSAVDTMCRNCPCEGHSLWLVFTPASVGNVKTSRFIGRSTWYAANPQGTG